MAGCQIVALNYQNFDTSMRINQGLFLQNNNCGYVLKPASMRNGEPVTEAFTIKLAVISGYMLPKPRNSKKGEIVDPFVTIKLITPDVQSKSWEKFKTKAVDDNGFNPVWDSNTKSPTIFVFKTKVTVPELSFLMITIRDKDLLLDDLIATATIPCNCLNQGFRLVSLYDHNGALLPFSNLFVFLEVTKL